MISMWRKLLGLFTKTLKVLEEQKQMNLIQSVGKDDNGYATVDVIPVGNDQACTFFPHQIMSDPCIKTQFMPADLKLIKGMLTTEGDIFIESKEYCGDDEIYTLRSLLDNEQWKLTYKQIETQKQIRNRINKRFFSNSLQDQLLHA